MGALSLNNRETKKLENRAQAKQEFIQAIKSKGGALTLDQAALALKTTSEAVRLLIGSGSLISLEEGQHSEMVIPGFQIRDGQPLPHLSRLICAMRAANWSDEFTVNCLINCTLDSTMTVPFYKLLSDDLTEETLSAIESAMAGYRTC